MKYLAIVIGAFVALFATSANANQITAFGQSSNSNTVTATANGTDTATTISVTDANIGITQLFANSPVGALFSLTATSTDSVTGVGTALLQHYSGNFCLTSGAGCGGINYLTGNFSDAAFGIAGGAQLSVNVANPPDTLNLTSDVIPTADLLPPSSFTLSFSNVTPGLGEVGSTLGNFTASFSGVASANVIAVPEVSSIAPFLVGIGALAMLRRKRNAA